jgi:hypothetical protein
MSLRPLGPSRGVIRTHAVVILCYVAVAVAFSWPLPLHLSTHLTGDTAGDTGVYVWNQWLFRRELLGGGRSPYFTDRIFAASGYDANLSLHNYTPFQNVLALPLVGTFGVVATFNIVMLATHVLTAVATYLLARRLTGRTMESWLAGMVFAWSPVLVTRSMGHFSLVAAAPLAVFLLLLWDAWQRTRWGWGRAFAAGLTIAWAATADVYYGIYCLMIGGVFLLHRAVITAPRAPAELRAARRVVSAAAVAVCALVIGIAVSGGGRAEILGIGISVRSLYTPMLVLTVLVALRVTLGYRVALGDVTRADVGTAMRMIGGAGATAVVALSPLLYAFGQRLATTGFDSSPIYWRSSPPGVDVLAFVIPNPNHPWAPAVWRQWLSMPRPDAYLENVASVPLVVLAVGLLAWRLGWRPAPWWSLVAAAFGLLALGPFVQVAGLSTHVPGPWALLRYVPLVGLTRTPARFSVVMMLAVSLLFAAALVTAGSRWPAWRRRGLALVTAGLCVELLPAPRPLYSARVPEFYAQVAAAPPETRVLHLPFGVRDGTTSDGDFSAQTQYFQTAHGQPLLGGYLSRVSKARRAAVRREPVLDAMMRMSEAHVASPDDAVTLARDGPGYLRRANVGFVVVNRRQFPQEVAVRTTEALRLQLVGSDGDFELYRPVHDP